VLTEQTGTQKHLEDPTVCQWKNECPPVDRRGLAEELEKNNNLLSLPTHDFLVEAILQRDWCCLLHVLVTREHRQRLQIQLV